MGNSDKQIGLSIFFIGSIGFIYYTLSTIVILLFPTTNGPPPTNHPYLIPYRLLIKIPVIPLILFISLIGTCISLVMIKQAIKDYRAFHNRSIKTKISSITILASS
ncbi:hypothetical protein PGT21_009804 [Puccinia graminis f. sp. tritici]|uniref:Dolichol phosphate-mannose biosynthesis regulatory protein n=1 Tax=Puccinia graminis f. sp. tritici TaxID=56615 RepID=A0A5B0NYR2_PUCGR|nr:hypothetical protein PGTUg99_032736 [Puccinia graminis f. sp. tritici]KAA1094103.1 hypothetical protein PGT21_009804 [Puccinia graminis f. sp. tritici]